MQVHLVGIFLATKTACTVMDILLDTDLLDKVKGISEYLFSKLRILADEDKNINTIRGIGLMVGIVLNSRAKVVQENLLKNGLLTSCCGEDVIRMLPPLIITKNEVDKAIDILKQTLSES